MKTYWNWRDEIDEGVLAWRVPKVEKLGWIKKRKIKEFILSPNDAVVILREGKVEDVLTQTHVKKLAGYMDKGAYYEFLFMTVAPVEMQFGFDAITRDNEKVEAKASMLFQFNLGTAQKLLPLVESKRTIEKRDVWQILHEKLGQNVVYPAIKQYAVSEIRGNVGLQKKMQTQAMVELRKSLEMWSMELVDFVMSWDMQEYEAMLTRQRQVQRQSRERIAREDAVHEEWMALQRRKKDWEVGEVEIDEARKTTSHDAEIGRQKSRWELEMEQDKAELDVAFQAKGKLDELKRQRLQHQTDMDIQKYQATDLESQKVDVEKEKHKLETYKDAEAEVRQTQLDMMKAMAGVMSGKDVGGGGRNCVKCGRAVQEEFKICPFCGHKLK